MDSNYTNINKTVNYSSGIIKTDENICSDEYDLLYWAYFIPNGFDNKIVRIIGQAGFDPKFEKDDFEFHYYTETDVVVCDNMFYRKTYVSNETFNQYKDNIVYENNSATASSVSTTTTTTSSEESLEPLLPWIRYPRTKDGVLLPLLIKKIFGRIPTKIIFKSTY
jgi:hypothetical protein